MKVMNEIKEVHSKDYYFGQKYSNYSDYNCFDNDRYWKPEIQTIKKYNLHGKILDIGCAFGFFLKRASPFFQELYGLDISQFAIEEAKKLNPTTNFQVFDLDKQPVPYPDLYFDLITAFDVLEHTQSIKDSLGKIVPKLKTGGFFICSVPLLDTWAGKIFHIFDKDVTHVSVPKKQDIIKQIKEAGLTILEYRLYLNLPFVKMPGIPVVMELITKKT
jgi:SAM-dependent methyltransferase